VESEVYNQIISIGIAIVSAWLAAKLAIRKFQAERTWLRKSDIYSGILESIHEMVFYLEYMNDVDLEKREPTEERYESLKENRRKAEDRLIKYHFVDSFLLCKKAQEEMDWIMRNIQNSKEKKTTREYSEYLIAELEERAKSLRMIASKDLGT